jgi:hypothetical protein
VSLGASLDPPRRGAGVGQARRANPAGGQRDCACKDRPAALGNGFTEGTAPAFAAFALKSVNVSKPTLKTRSWELYRLHLEKFLIPEFGTERVDQIVLEHIALFRARLLTARKLQRRRTIGLRRPLRKAHEYRLVPYVPTPKKARVPKHPRFFDFETAELALEAGEAWGGAPRPFLMRTGLRIGGALELKGSAVDRSGRRLFVARGVYAGEVGDTNNSRTGCPAACFCRRRVEATGARGLPGRYVFPRKAHLASRIQSRTRVSFWSSPRKYSELPRHKAGELGFEPR